MGIGRIDEDQRLMRLDDRNLASSLYDSKKCPYLLVSQTNLSTGVKQTTHVVPRGFDRIPLIKHLVSVLSNACLGSGPKEKRWNKAKFIKQPASPLPDDAHHP